MSETEFKETVTPKQCALFYEAEMAPIFCKPKLLPMKTVTMEKLEKMQREAEKLMVQQTQPQDEQELPLSPIDDTVSGEKLTEVWTADD